MKNFFLISVCLLGIFFKAAANISPSQLTCEYLHDPAVIDVYNPRLSWINTAGNNERGQYQTAWEIRVAGSLDQIKGGKADLWESGKIMSDLSINVRYNGKPLKSRQECYWQVRVWDKDGKVSGWSEPGFWRMGILDQSEWKSEWIGAPWQGEEALPKPSNPGAKQPELLPPPAPMFRKEFNTWKKIRKAVAFVTGLGYFELFINGKKAGEDVLVPNQTNYGRRPYLKRENIPLEDNFKEYKVFYLAYDVSGLIKEGKNAIGSIIGNGFYNPAKYWAGGYGSPRFLMQLYIDYEDGSKDIVITDGTWKVSESPVRMDMVYYGEHYDARFEQPGWCEGGFNDSGWKNAIVRKAPEGKLRAHTAPTDRIMEVIEPVKIEKTGKNTFKVDFGQEISGWVHLTGIKGKKGQKIDIRYLHKFAQSGDNSYTLIGGETESYRARFTWFVFREVEISNWPGDFKPDQIKAEAVYTNIETTAAFKSSDKLLNDINRIWWRSQTDNMHGGIASDCPNRERSPYTGDGQVSCVTVMHNFDARAFYNKWIHDIIGAEDTITGYVPNGAPWQPGCGGGVAWGAAINIMPWEYYVHYGDTAILSDSYEGMKGYVRYMLTWTDNEGIMLSQAKGRDGKPNRWMNLGEWSQPYELPPDDLVHTFYLWYCSDLTSKAAAVLGRSDESLKFSVVAEKTRKAFMSRFWDESKGSYGKYGGSIFALKMGVPDDRKQRVVNALASDLKANDGHLDTGIFGTRFFFEVLAENGLTETAYEAMNKRTFPSYGYWLEQGATTSWEGWKDAGSGNHPMFGGGLVWLYRNLAGFKADETNPGYRHIVFRPQPAGDVKEVSYSNRTPYGLSEIKWKREGVSFILNINIPVGTEATVYVPAVNKESVTESGRSLMECPDASFIKMEEGYAVLRVNSGSYSFKSALN